MAKITLDIKGPIINDSMAVCYKWYGMSYTSNTDVQKILSSVKNGDDLEVRINSPGGVIDAGAEIYTALMEIKKKCNMKIKIIGHACSAASIIAMAGESEMTPTGMMMVHCVSTSASGNHSDMEHTAEMLRKADKALCSAYMKKTGMSEQEALDMMEKETWLTAQQALEIGLIDKIMFEEDEQLNMVAAYGIYIPSQEQIENARKAFEKSKQENENEKKKTDEPIQKNDVVQKQSENSIQKNFTCPAGKNSEPEERKELLARLAFMRLNTRKQDVIY